MRAARRGAGTTFVVVLCLAQLCLGGDCVDGVTPDCSDAAARCGPDVDGATIDGPSEASTDAAIDRATPPADSGSDADSASDADASDQ